MHRILNPGLSSCRSASAAEKGPDFHGTCQNRAPFGCSQRIARPIIIMSTEIFVILYNDVKNLQDR